jgi:hypothetical protein
MGAGSSRAENASSGTDNSIASYYDLLGVAEDASSDDIKVILFSDLDPIRFDHQTNSVLNFAPESFSKTSITASSRQEC